MSDGRHTTQTKSCQALIISKHSSVTDAGRARNRLDLVSFHLCELSVTRWTPVVIEVTEGELDGGAHVALLEADIELMMFILVSRPASCTLSDNIYLECRCV